MTFKDRHISLERDLLMKIGAELLFPGIGVIQRNFNLALGYDFPIYGSLSETVDAAVAKAVS